MPNLIFLRDRKSKGGEENRNVAKPPTSQEKIITYGYHPTFTVSLPPGRRLKQTNQKNGEAPPQLLQAMLLYVTAIMPHVAALTHSHHTSSSSPSPAYKCGGGSAQQLVASGKLIMEEINASKLRSQFLRLLSTRRSPQVPLSVELGHPVLDPLYQETPHLKFSEAMESCPKEDIPNLKDLKEENLYLKTESGEQGRLPVLILSMKENSHHRRPAVVFLHSTKKCKEWLRPLLEAYASRGYVAVAIDSRYHGERASSMTTYRDALVSSWRKGDTMPFIFDTVWDLIKLADYLTQRADIDPSKIGITGESLGGMHAWFAAAADTRYAVAVPIIGVQGFRWAIDHNKWQSRVDSIKDVFEEARVDLGKSVIDKEVLEKVWDRIAPGLASEFDSPYTIPLIAPRPLLILNGEKDPRCPIEGLEIPKSRAHKAYEEAHCPDKFKLIAQPGIGHELTPFMVKEASDWFDRFLK